MWGHAIGLGVEAVTGMEAEAGQGVVGGDQIHGTQILSTKKSENLQILTLTYLRVLMNVILSVITSQVLLVSFIGINVLIEIIGEFLNIH